MSRFRICFKNLFLIRYRYLAMSFLGWIRNCIELVNRTCSAVLRSDGTELCLYFIHFVKYYCIYSQLYSIDSRLKEVINCDFFPETFRFKFLNRNVIIFSENYLNITLSYTNCHQTSSKWPKRTWKTITTLPFLYAVRYPSIFW